MDFSPSRIYAKRKMETAVGVFWPSDEASQFRALSSWRWSAGSETLASTRSRPLARCLATCSQSAGSRRSSWKSASYQKGGYYSARTHNIRRLEKLKWTDSRRYLYEGELPETDVVADHQLEVSEVVRDGAVEEDIEGDGSPLVLNALNQVGQVHSVANLQNGEIDQSQCAWCIEKLNSRGSLPEIGRWWFLRPRACALRSWCRSGAYTNEIFPTKSFVTILVLINIT